MSSGPDDVEKVRELFPMCTHFLEKPFTANSLLDRIGSLFEQAQTP
jgi:hypothetical protein